MNQQQVNEVRNQINAAHAAGDVAKADKLQAKLHAHFAAQADAFVSSTDGRSHMDRLLAKA